MRRALAGAVLLIVVALAGCTDDGEATVPDEPPFTGVLEAAFGYEVELGESGPTHCPVAEIRFTDQSEGEPTSWSWEFSDFTTSTEQNPVVRNEVTAATLTVTRGDESDTVTEPVTFAVC